MDVIRLRTLAPKSILWFGENMGLSVEQMITLKRVSYLVWIYYNIEGVTFLPELLDKMNIHHEERIAKPGVNPTMREKREKRIEHTFKGLEGYVFRKKSIRKVRAANASKQKYRRLSKGRLQSINHGR